MSYELVDVDCSRVRELARQELRRRAKQSDQKRSLYVIGDRLARRWEVLDVCGGKDRSGMGVVYVVRDSVTGRTEASKTFQHDLKHFDGLRQALRHEAELWIRLGKHPNIVQARYVDTMGDQIYIFMEYVAPDRQGRNSLSHYLKDGPLPEDQFLKWAIQACRGMAHAHSRGLEGHRDIKPDNLLISAYGDLKITDFGLARAYANAEDAKRTLPATGIFTSGGQEAPGLTCTNLLVGTPGYIAPEIVAGQRADIRSDIYSFGLVLHQMLTGQQRPPLTAAWKGDLMAYERETLELRKAHQAPALVPKFEGIVAKCLRYAPSDRFQNFTEVLTELQPLAQTHFSVTSEPEDALSVGEMIDQATTLFRFGRLREALDCIRQAKDIDPDNAGAWNSEGAILTDMGHYDEALRCFDRSIELSPTWTPSWSNKGRALRRMGRFSEALECYERAISHDPRHVPPWVSKGNCLYDLGRYQEALVAYDEAIKVDENWVDAWAEKGRALIKLGRSPEALASLKRVLELNPQNDYAEKEYRRLLGQQPEK